MVSVPCIFVKQTSVDIVASSTKRDEGELSDPSDRNQKVADLWLTDGICGHSPCIWTYQTCGCSRRSGS